jgi:hypothetical protein
MADNTKKSLVEEALLQMKNLEEAVTENAKGILASTMKEEISELVKESLSDVDEDMVNTDITEQGIEVGDEEEVEMEPEMGDMDADEDSEMEDEDEGGEEVDMEDMLMLDLPGDDLEVDDEEEVLLPLDLTGASDEEILKVFKAMGDEDGIIVKQDGDNIHLSDEDEDVEYIIQTESEDELPEMDSMGDIDEEEDGEVVFEIEMEEDEEGAKEEETEMVDEEWNEEESNEGYNHDLDISLGKDHGKKMKQSFTDRRKESKGMEKAMGKRPYSGDKSMDLTAGETAEAARTLGNGSDNFPGRGLPKKKVSTVSESELKAEVQSLRAKNEEYRKALNIFREKLNEVAVFNSNLAYATRLFTEHSTTKQEKINILRRFDSVETLKESKTLYKTLKEEYDGKNSVVTESVQSKVQKSPSKGSATNLIESKTYENPQFLRMRDLMNKLTK